MKKYEVNKSIYRVSSLRAGAVVLSCAILCCLCGSCRSSRSVSQSSSTERHEVFDNSTAADTLDLTSSVNEVDTAAVNINEAHTDTIKIERDDAGRPVLIVWNHNKKVVGEVIRSKISDLNLTGFQTTHTDKSSGTVDAFDQKKEESKTEIDPALPLEYILGPILLGLVILYVIYVIIADGIWPRLKKSIFLTRSNK